MSKKQEIAALKEVLTALADNNNTIYAETVDAQSDDGRNWRYRVNGKEGKYILPSKNARDVSNSIAMHVNSFKIGKDISVRTVRGKWVIRTPKWEVRYDTQTEELDGLLSALRKRYEGQSLTDSLYRLRTYCQNDELREFAKNLKEVKTTKKSKYEKAIENLKSLGVEPNKLMEYIKKNQMDK